MFGWVLSLTGVFLELLILCRASSSGTLRRYPLFYSYLALVFLADVYRDVVFFLYGDVALHLPVYRNLYFATEFLSLLVGYGVILEVTRKSFEPYAGAERFSRYLVVAIFLAIFGYVGIKTVASAGWAPATSLRELERDLRAVQALVIAGVVAIALYYGIEIGRNIGGIMLGYGLYTASTVCTLALRSYGGPLALGITFSIQRYSYLFCLIIWAVALWFYQPNPVPDTALRLEADYESLVGRTRSVLGSMRSLLERSARP